MGMPGCWGGRGADGRVPREQRGQESHLKVESPHEVLIQTSAAGFCIMLLWWGEGGRGAGEMRGSPGPPVPGRVVGLRLPHWPVLQGWALPG